LKVAHFLFTLLFVSLIVPIAFAESTLEINAVIGGSAEMNYSFASFDKNYEIELVSPRSVFNDGCVESNQNITISEGTTCKYTYYTNGIINKKKEIWSIKLNDEQEYDNLIVKIPDNYSVERMDDASKVYFEGNKIILEWHNYSPSDLKVEYKEREIEFIVSSSLIYAIAFPILVILIAVLYVHITQKYRERFSKLGKKMTEKQHHIYNTLSDVEQKILLLVIDNQVLAQKEIVLKSELPKSTVSRWVTKLCEKNILNCSDSLQTKKITLSEWFKSLK